MLQKHCVIDIQHASVDGLPVFDEHIQTWVESVLLHEHRPGEITLRFVNSEEIQTLNHTYRHHNKPTNVLSFPSEIPPMMQTDCPFLGDIILCPDVLYQEAHTQGIPLIAHWAHIIIHGVLHLLGYDHAHDDDTMIMQTLEIKLLGALGFDNPYLNEDTSC